MNIFMGLGVIVISYIFGTNDPATLHDVLFLTGTVILCIGLDKVRE